MTVAPILVCPPEGNTMGVRGESSCNVMYGQFSDLGWLGTCSWFPEDLLR